MNRSGRHSGPTQVVTEAVHDIFTQDQMMRNTAHQQLLELNAVLLMHNLHMTSYTNSCVKPQKSRGYLCVLAVCGEQPVPAFFHPCGCARGEQLDKMQPQEQRHRSSDNRQPGYARQVLVTCNCGQDTADTHTTVATSSSAG
jgi:hypothetical protein